MRLNANVRAEIIRNATEKLRLRELALCKTSDRLGLACYKIAVDAAVRKAAALMPDNWLEKTLTISFNVAGQSVVLTCNPALPVPARYRGSYGGQYLGKAITLTDHPELVREVREWQHDIEQFKQDKKVAEQTLHAMLKHVGSTDSLFKLWPEGKKFYSVPPLTPQVRTGVPAVQMQKLNEMLGLSA